jgi:death-on-curing protein
VPGRPDLGARPRRSGVCRRPAATDVREARAYPTLATKAAALCHSIALNHSFGDGNKRVAHAAAETFLVLNGHELSASVDDAERVMLDLAGGRIDRDVLAEWFRARLKRL